MSHTLRDLVLGAKFVFYWPLNSVDGVYPADRVFHPDFLLSHQLTELPDGQQVRFDGKRARVGKGSGIRLKEIVELRRGPYRGVRVQIVRALQGVDLPLGSLNDTFRRIRFHPRLESVREYVDSELPRFALAIHIRRGDSFWTDNRIGGRFVMKHIPLPIIRRVLDSLPVDRPVLLVGNEMDLIQSLVTKPWIYSLAHFQYPGDTAPDKSDFFDFLALTKCDAILGGTSHFAVYPSQIGASTLLTPSDLLSHEETKACLMAYIRQHPRSDDSLEVALACEYTLRVLAACCPPKSGTFYS